MSKHGFEHDPSQGRDGDCEDNHCRPYDGHGSGDADGAVGDRKQLPALSARRARQSAQARATRPDLYGGDAFAEQTAAQDEPAFDYRKYLGILNKDRWLIAGIAAVSITAGLVYTLLQTPTYRSSTTIQINREAANISGIAGLEPVEAGRSNEFYQTQYELLKSRALAQRVVSTLGLADDPEFFRTPPSQWAKLQELILPAGYEEAPSIAARHSMAVGAVLRGVSVEPVRSSSLVRINFDGTDPRLAQRVADAIADNFITSNLERSFEASAYARKFLETRLQELALKLDESERQLVAYAEAMDMSATGSDQSLSMTNLAAANTALGEVHMERLRHEMRWRQAEEHGLSLIVETEAIKQLRAQRSEQTLIHEDRMKFAPKAPGTARLEAGIDEIDRQIEAEVERITDSLKLQYEASLKEEEGLLRRVSELKAEVMDYQNRNIQYTILRREVETNGLLYEGLLQRYKEIGVSGGVDRHNATTNISVVDRAQAPGGPYKPVLSLNLAAALLLGLILGGATAFARDIIDNSFHTPEELEEGLGIPLLGIIPLSDEASDVVSVLNDRRSFLSEAYRSLRTALLFSTAAGTPRSFVVTSALDGEGKSTAAINLAAQSAKLGLRVLLIDADLRDPSLHQVLGCDGSTGLAQYLAGGSTYSEAFQSTDLPSLTLLPAGPLSSNSAELLSGARMASLIAAASQDFDLVVVDAPPVGGLADAPLLASMCDGTLLVVEANKTHRRAAVAALKRLQFARAELVGVVFNKFDAKRAGYGYGYGYGNDRYYGHGSSTQKSLLGAGAG